MQILLSTPHGGFSETTINSTGNQNKQKNTQELSINNYYETIIMKLFAYRIYDITNWLSIKLLRNYLHINLWL